MEKLFHLVFLLTFFFQLFHVVVELLRQQVDHLCLRVLDGALTGKAAIFFDVGFVIE
jgi:hypothetical protein